VNYTVGSSGTSPAVAGADYTLAAGTLTFAPGETVKTVPLVILDNDTTGDLPRTFQITLSDPVGASLNAASVFTTTIVDDDVVVNLRFQFATSNDAGEGAAAGGNGTFNIQRTGPTTSILNVNIAMSGTATNGVDYRGTGAPYLQTAIGSTLPISSTSANLGIEPIIDSETDPNETVTLTVLPGPGYKLGATTTLTMIIKEPTNKPTVSIVPVFAQVAESGGAVGAFQVSRTGPTTAALTVNFKEIGNATSTSVLSTQPTALTDFTALAASTQLAIGQSTKTITLTPTADAVVEGDETVGLLIYGPNENYTVSPTQARR
jgi:hypothetical protein